jgi:hypothetical protein
MHVAQGSSSAEPSETQHSSQIDGDRHPADHHLCASWNLRTATLFPTPAGPHDVRPTPWKTSRRGEATHRNRSSQVPLPRRRHEIPSVIAEKSTILLGHSLELVGILERRAFAEEGTGEYLLKEACKLSRSRGGTCMPEVLCVRCTGKDTGEGACADKGGGEGAGEGGAVGVCGATGGMTIEGTSLTNS